MRFILLLIVTLISVSACSKNLKEKIGITTIGPDEYSVIRNKSLEIPPHYNLPLPTSKSEESFSKEDNSLNEGEKALIKDISK